MGRQMGIQISYGTHALKLGSWDDERAMLDHLATLEGGQVILGASAGYAIEFYTAIVLIDPGGPRISRFGIGIRSEGHGLVPQLLPRHGEDLLVFGFNQEVCGVSIRERGLRFAVNCASLVYALVVPDGGDLLLVLHELGALAVTLEGVRRWEYTADVLTHWRMENHRLRLEFMEGTPVELDVATGRVR
jgi:hypothetical protein